MPHKIEYDDIFGPFAELTDFDATTSDNDEVWSLLETASAENDLDTVQEIIKSKELVPLGFFTASAVMAIENDNADIVTALLEAGLPVNESLVRAALKSSKNYQYLRLFVASGWDVNSRLTSHTPSVLALAAEAGDLELVKWLLQELRADVNVECEQLHTPLSVALQHAPEAIVDIMLEQHVRTDVGQLIHHALWRALKQPKWNTRLMSILIERGAPINKKMYDCEEESEIVHQMKALPFGTPLHIAVEAESIDAVEYLLQHGARIDIQNEENKTPLDIATGEIRHLLQGR